MKIYEQRQFLTILTLIPIKTHLDTACRTSAQEILSLHLIRRQRCRISRHPYILQLCRLTTQRMKHGITLPVLIAIGQCIKKSSASSRNAVFSFSVGNRFSGTFPCTLPDNRAAPITNKDTIPLIIYASSFSISSNRRNSDSSISPIISSIRLPADMMAS